MAGFDVDPPALRSAAARLGEAASAVGACDAAADLSGVPAAIADGLASSAARRLGQAWDARFRAWAEDADEHAASLTGAADAYEASDVGTGSALAGSPS
ncbi:hypothetical protein Bcav_3285 [Beutenbergia cavernae DSM 12333]|uniref:Excreted virulence factor EspC, type VII ESX diderm n=1 Tax=Beutenbergia cavernae (strain ATCC BAA-8 / DSM 12333 / CCUG 43141 / JCM 11478 / NBRC 16432 / NCIMB 13614 / HKI 0122) TaxID=471853 RepID=C5C1B8_BEUC1|nr:type VII secretion target [Beutenbergia cavernae]ACQ81528.1 hypothetical protein Bcav_3285 [Beutenbergia cavernae DSM 12333]